MVYTIIFEVSTGIRPGRELTGCKLQFYLSHRSLATEVHSYHSQNEAGVVKIRE